MALTITTPTTFIQRVGSRASERREQQQREKKKTTHLHTHTHTLSRHDADNRDAFTWTATIQKREHTDQTEVSMKIKMARLIQDQDR